MVQLKARFRMERSETRNDGESQDTFICGHFLRRLYCQMCTFPPALPSSGLRSGIAFAQHEKLFRPQLNEYRLIWSCSGAFSSGLKVLFFVDMIHLPKVLTTLQRRDSEGGKYFCAILT